MTAPDTTVVVPCYQEASRLNLDAFRDFLDATPRIEFLFVDDGSSDGSPELLQSLAAASERVRCLLRPQNGGKAAAVRDGVQQALAGGSAFVAYWDADLATPLSELPGFLADAEADPRRVLIAGARVARLGANIRRSTARHLAGRVFATAASAALGLAVYDTQCGAKLLRACPAVEAAFAHPFTSRWAFDVELFARLADALGADSATALYERPLTVWNDVPGSKLGLPAAIKAFADLAAVARSRRSR